MKRVYQVEGLMGNGPWFDTPEEAAEFVKDESRADPGGNGAVEFSDADLRFLAQPGYVIAQSGWCIAARDVSDEEREREWDGW